MKLNRNVTLLAAFIAAQCKIKPGVALVAFPRLSLPFVSRLLAHSSEKYLMLNRRCADLERRTLVRSDGGGLLIPSKQFWYERNVRTLWWDLDSLYQNEVAERITSFSKSRWYKNFAQQIAPYMPAGDPVHGGLPAFIRQNWQANVFIGILDDVNF